jgi:hypothetical protein
MDVPAVIAEVVALAFGRHDHLVRMEVAHVRMQIDELRYRRPDPALRLDIRDPHVQRRECRMERDRRGGDHELRADVIADDRPDPLEVVQHLRDREPVEDRAEGWKDRRVRDLAVGVAGRRAAPGFDQAERHHDDPGAAEQRVGGGICRGPAGEKGGLIGVAGVVVAEGIDEAVLDPPRRVGRPFGPAAGETLELLADGGRRVEEAARMHSARDVDRAHDLRQLLGKAAPDRRDLRRLVDEPDGLGADPLLAIRPGVDVAQLPVAVATLQRRHGSRIPPPSEDQAERGRGEPICFLDADRDHASSRWSIHLTPSSARRG